MTVLSVEVVATHLLLAAALFFIINWIGSHSLPLGYMQLSLFVKADEAPAFNLVFRVLTPVVYIVIVSAGLYLTGLDFLTRHIFLVVIYYFALRLAFNVITGRTRLLNWRLQAVYFLLSSVLAYLAYTQLIFQRSHLLPEFRAMANQLWIVIAGFIYLLFNKVRLSTASTEKRKKDYLSHRYRLYRMKYGSIVTSKTQDPNVEALIYAVMIYENFNRPKAYRILEALLFRVGLSHTLGIMQVRTDSPISDEKSVAIGSDKILKDYLDAISVHDENAKRTYERIGDSGLELYKKHQEHAASQKALMKYNPSGSYVSEVTTLRDTLLRTFYADGAK